jgi:flavodoxin/Pyruvate/2-oxoacid:ferredoxin oxidoreductase delta subunit
MKALVVYFSQTGNTRLVAEAVGRGLREAGAEAVDVLPIDKADPQSYAACDLLAVGTPVFYYKEAAVVRDWIARLPSRTGPAPALTFNTNGGNPCNTLRRMKKQLAAKGARVVGSYECWGFDTYPIYLKSFRKWGHPDGADLAGAEDFGRRMLPQARRLAAGEDVPPPVYPFVGGKTFRLSVLCRKPILDWFFPRLNVVADLCTRCGACVRGCPTENIRLAPGPVFDNRCIHCYMCERICPHNAIQCDWRRLTRKMNP